MAGDILNTVSMYATDCEIRGFQHNSITTYASHVRDFLGYVQDPTTVDMEMLRQHLQYLRHRNYAASTYNSYYTALESYYDWLIFEGKVNSNPIPPFRKRYLKRVMQAAPKSDRQNIEIHHVRQLLKEAQKLGICHTAIILTFAKTGLRRGEFLDLKESDLDFQNHIIKVPTKSKRSSNIVFMDSELEQVLKQYLVWRGRHVKPSCKWLWVS